MKKSDGRGAIAKAVLAERKACAKVAKKLGPKFYHKQMHDAADAVAAAIMARK